MLVPPKSDPYRPRNVGRKENCALKQLHIHANSIGVNSTAVAAELNARLQFAKKWCSNMESMHPHTASKEQKRMLLAKYKIGLTMRATADHGVVV